MVAPSESIKLQSVAPEVVVEVSVVAVEVVEGLSNYIPCSTIETDN